MEPKNLLVVDDDETFCEVTATMLGELGYQVVTEMDSHRVLPLLKEGDFDVVLLDLVMPGMDGLDLIERIREHFSALPILVVTGYGGGEATMAAMRRGATDFVTKPAEMSLLDLRIRRVFDLEHARRLANTDGLTGLYNHRYLQERLLQEVGRADRYQRPLSVVMADLDHFKLFNDTYGHPRGDEVLIEVAKTLRRVSRATDVVARYGGEEFTLILPETDISEARIMAERARQCVESLNFDLPDASITLSLGVACHHRREPSEKLIRVADAALYEAKRRGRNRVCVIEDDELDDPERRMQELRPY